MKIFLSVVFMVFLYTGSAWGIVVFKTPEETKASIMEHIAPAVGDLEMNNDLQEKEVKNNMFFNGGTKVFGEGLKLVNEALKSKGFEVVLEQTFNQGMAGSVFKLKVVRKSQPVINWHGF